MDNKNKYTEFTYHISRYLSGEMNADEQVSFKKRLQQDQNLSSEFESAKQAWDLMDYYTSETTNKVDTDKGWNILSSRISVNEITESRVQKKQTNQFPVWLQWAAMILLIAGLGWVGYLKWVQTADEDWMVVQNTDTENVVVKTLEDGSVVYLAKEAQVRYPGSFDAADRNVQMEGEVFFDVVSDTLKPFTIQAGNATIEVLGTAFNVKNTNEEVLELFVETGKVRVWYDDNKNESVLVHKDQLLRMENGIAEILFPTSYNTLWRNNLLRFKDESLKNILKVLSKTYDYTFETEDDTLDNRVLTITIDDSSIETVSQLIAISLSVDYEITDNSRVVFSNPK
jgi:ferric-dicitrate binding protein FerR (iron transport regulator)